VKLHELPARSEGGVHVVVESPRGARLKMKYEPENGLFFGGRALPLGQRYPFDWGFVPGTKAADGDPFDALVYWEVSSYPGTVLRCRLLGVLELEEDEGGERVRNDRLVALPLGLDRDDHFRSMHDLAPRAREELELFFTSTVFFTGKNPKVIGWGGPEEADRLLAAATPTRRGGRKVAAGRKVAPARAAARATGARRGRR
jgi:inorganic pyrophosphatase